MRSNFSSVRASKKSGETAAKGMEDVVSSEIENAMRMNETR